MARYVLLFALLRRIFGGNDTCNQDTPSKIPKIPGMRAQWKQLEAAPYDTLISCQWPVALVGLGWSQWGYMYQACMQFRQPEQNGFTTK